LRLSILFMGVGGQGIVFAADVLAEALFKCDLNVATIQGYGAEVRGGPVYSYVIADDSPIENVFIESFDIAIVLHQSPLKIWRHMVESSRVIIYNSDIAKLERGYPLSLTRIAVENKLEGSENLVAVGIALALASIPGEIIIETLPEDAKTEKNIKAIKLGYLLGEDLKGKATPNSIPLKGSTANKPIKSDEKTLKERLREGEV